MHLLLLGVNHRTASLRERESLALDRDQTSRVLAAVLGQGAADEAFVLSTCNRTEFYLSTTDPSRAASGIDAAVRDVKDAALSLGDGTTYQHTNGAAVRHLLRVATGLDSMVLGEPQILSQMKDAFGLARDQGATGTLLDRLIETALRTGKRARAETAIGAGVVSVASAACELARRHMPSLDGRRVVVIGAGETGRLAAQHLARYCPGGVTIVNRSATRAADGRRASSAPPSRPLSEVGAAVADADLVISATSAPGTILTADAVREAMAARPGPAARHHRPGRPARRRVRRGRPCPVSRFIRSTTSRLSWTAASRAARQKRRGWTPSSTRKRRDSTCGSARSRPRRSCATSASTSNACASRNSTARSRT